MNRAQQLAALAPHAVHDLVVIGGGATGLGVALDAVLRGFSVLLLESHDFAGGTSSRSTKLLHGGVRYLAQGNVSLVREALSERATLLSLAPHLAQPLPFVMPSYRWWQTPFYGMGLKIYDLLAGPSGLGSTQLLNRSQTLAALPGVQPAGLRGGVQYWDGQFDDARLALSLARSIERAGGVPVNYMAVKRVHRLKDKREDGARYALDLQDRRGQGVYTVLARAVVNATGVWVDGVREQALADVGQAVAQRLVSASQGVHVVVDRSFMPGNHALLVPKTQDGRVLFVVPWLGSLILGTTDTPREDLPREPEPFESELAFILQEASKVLQREVRREDAKSVWVGLRPLVATHKEGAGTQRLSREHTIVVDPNGMVTVTGGKWTTYRAMAEDVMAACFKEGGLPWRESGATAAHVLEGAGPHEGGVALSEPPGWHLYGSDAQAVRECGGADVELGMGLTAAMVRYAARQEYAWTVEDVLARRWRALFLDAAKAKAMGPAVAELLRAETGEDPQLGAFLALCERYSG